ncbi:hypothetical protein [Micromonospora sp. NPDC049799]
MGAPPLPADRAPAGPTPLVPAKDRAFARPRRRFAAPNSESFHPPNE